jgi:RNA polymerase sigma-70 factor
VAFYAEREDAPPASEEQLALALREIADRLRATPLPGDAPNAQAFARYLGARVDGEPSAERLGGLCVEDLALAWACACGRPGAVAALERMHFPAVQAALARMPDARAQSDEILQRLRTRLFVGEAETPPRIAQYRGRGPLRAWLRVAAMRCALSLIAGPRREVELPDRLLDGLAGPDDQELAHLKATYRHAFKDAFEAALAALGPSERNLLYYHHLEGLTVDQLAPLYGVHRATCARRLARLRQQLLDHTRASLMHDLGVDRGELESIMRLIDSHLEASIERFLLASDERGEP